MGTVTASLRKDMQQAVSDDIRLDVVVKTLLYEELEEEEQTGDIDTIDISHVSFSHYARSQTSSQKYITWFITSLNGKLPRDFDNLMSNNQ